MNQKSRLESGSHPKSQPWMDSQEHRGLGRGHAQWQGGGGHSVGSVTPQTCRSRNFDARKLLESFLGLVPRVQGGKCPWVTDSWFREAPELVATCVCRKGGSPCLHGLTPPSGSQGVRPFSPKFVRGCWVCGQEADTGFCLQVQQEVVQGKARHPGGCWLVSELVSSSW